MTCARIRPLLPELAGGEISARDRALCEAHLASCAACRQRHEELRDAVLRLRRLGEAELPPGFAAALHRRLAQEPAPRRPLSSRLLDLLAPLRPGRALLVTGAVAALLVAVALRPGPNGPERLAGGEVTAPFQVPSRRVAVVHLDFVTNTVIDEVEFEVTLPAELAFISDGKPVPERTLRWTGSLAAGSNPIPLAVSGSRPGRYKIVARARGEGVDVTHDVHLELVAS